MIAPTLADVLSSPPAANEPATRSQATQLAVSLVGKVQKGTPLRQLGQDWVGVAKSQRLPKAIAAWMMAVWSSGDAEHKILESLASRRDLAPIFATALESA